MVYLMFVFLLLPLVMYSCVLMMPNSLAQTKVNCNLILTRWNLLLTIVSYLLPLLSVKNLPIKRKGSVNNNYFLGDCAIPCTFTYLYVYVFTFAIPLLLLFFYFCYFVFYFCY